MILYCLLTSAINAVASLVLALAVYWKKPRGPANLAFSAFALTGAIWSAFYFGWQASVDRQKAEFYARLLSAAAIFIPVAYFYFVGLLLAAQRKLELRLGWVLAVGLALASLVGPSVLSGVEPRGGFPWWPVPGPIYPVYLLVFFYYLAMPLWMLITGVRAAVGLRRNQLLLVTIGTAIGFLGGATNFFLWFNIPIPPVGNGLVAVYVAGVGLAIIRFRLMDFDLVVARFVVFFGLTVLLALLAPLLLFALSFLSIIEGSLRQVDFLPLFFASFVATGLLVGFLPGVRRQIDAVLEQRVLGDRLADRELLRTLAGRISSARDEMAMYEETADTVARALDVAEVSIFTRTEFESDFTRRTVVGRHAPGLEIVPENSPMVQQLREGNRGILLDELAHGPAGEPREYFSELRRRQVFELIVPIVGDTLFYGFITLGPRAGKALFNDVDVSLLEAVGLQVGLNLRARQLERRTNQTEKLIALGTLAAGLAHELRNPLTSIQTFSALLRERGSDPDFQQEFSAIVQRDVSRIASIVENVSAFAESNKLQVTSVQLEEVLKTVAEIVRPELHRAGVELQWTPAPLPLIVGNYSQLLQVFLNLVQNAVQAQEGRSGGRIAFSHEIRLGKAHQPRVCVSVSDNGPGIDPALLPRIFDPFITTKDTGARRGKHGMGLGLAIVKRIVQHHHGDIDVVSTPGRGTIFRVYLPVKP